MDKDWNLQATAKLVEKLYGRERAERVLKHCSSVNRRIEYAVYHYDQILRLHEEFMRDYMAGRHYLEVKFGPQEGRDALETYVKSAQAHALALTQSIHSIADLHAHTIYYGGRLDTMAKPLRERDIGAHHVHDRIVAISEFQALSGLWQSFKDSDEFIYVDGLVNLSKHRNLVLAGFFEDLTGQRDEKHELRIEAFTYQRDEAQRALKELFPKLVNGFSAFVADTGNELHRVLAARDAALP